MLTASGGFSVPKYIGIGTPPFFCAVNKHSHVIVGEYILKGGEYNNE